MLKMRSSTYFHMEVITLILLQITFIECLTDLIEDLQLLDESTILNVKSPLFHSSLELERKTITTNETTVVNIGLILSKQQESLEDLVTRRLKLSNHVNVVTAYIVPNPIEMSKIICNRLINGKTGGVVAVIVDTNDQYIDSVASISFTLGLYNIPIIGTTLRDSNQFKKNLHSSYISLIPPHSHQADVWYNLMTKFQFKKAFVLTSIDNRDLINRLNDLIDKQAKFGDEFKLEAIVEYDQSMFQSTHQAQNYLDKKVTTFLENSICRVFLIHAQSEEDTELFVNLINQLKLCEACFVLVFSEAATKVANQYNITLPSGVVTSQLSLASDDMHNSGAYVIDALDLVLRSIPETLQHAAAFRDVPNSCQVSPASDWQLGLEIYENVLQQTFLGHSGYISFDENGDRFTASYNLLNLADETSSTNSSLLMPSNESIVTSKTSHNQIWRKVGVFRNGISEAVDNSKVETTENVSLKGETSQINQYNSTVEIDISVMQWPGNIKGQPVSGIYIKRHLQIISLQEKPFVWITDEKDCWNESMSNKSNLETSVPCQRLNHEKGSYDKLCCTGYCMELLLEISQRLNFTFDLYLEKNNQYGSLEIDTSKISMVESANDDLPGTTSTGESNQAPADLPLSIMRDQNIVSGANIEPEGSISSANNAQRNEEIVSPRHGARFRWTGVIGELVSRKYDMAFAPLTITPQRALAIDFSKPFKFHGFSILLRRAPKHTTLASFLQPFHNQLWILVIGVATHVVAISLYLLDRYSTFGRFGMKRRFIPTTPRNSHDDHPLHMSSSLWFSWSILLNSGVGEHTPKSLSGRVLGIFWSGFAMIVVASYTANLAAFLVLDSREETPSLSGIDDPRLRSGDLTLNFATVKGSAVDTYLQSQVEYINLYRKMEEFNFDNVDKLIGALQNGTIDALIWDSTRLEWEVAMDEKCSLGIAGELFGSSGYGIGLQRDSYWTKNVTTKLLELHESGFMIDLDKKWISAAASRIRSPLSPQSQMITSGSSSGYSSTGGGANGNCERRNEDYPETLGIFNIAGVFILFAGGLVTSFGLIFVERLCYKHKAYLLERQRSWWRQLKGRS